MGAVVTTLHLGVLDIPHSGPGSKTTGDVADILEAKYGLMDGFMWLHGDDVAAIMADSMAGSIESIMAGTPPSDDPYGMSKVEDLFRKFLDDEEAQYIGSELPIPTQAALDGKSARFKRRRGPSRPSFIDSGEFQAAFKAWIEQ
jgi:hypothetical protein